jgi:hypothetical protein
MSIQFSYPSDLFDRFRNIHESDVYGVIRFYENHIDELYFIPFEERFIMLCYYSNALFAAEEHQKYLETAKKILEASIIERIQYVDGHDIYVHTLYQKAESHIRLRELNEAAKISRQLLTIAPTGKKKWFAQLRKALLLQRPLWVRKAFGLGMFATISWITTTFLSILVLEPFYPGINSLAIILQFTMLPMALFMCLAALAGHYLFVEYALLHKK